MSPQYLRLSLLFAQSKKNYDNFIFRYMNLNISLQFASIRITVTLFVQSKIIIAEYCNIFNKNLNYMIQYHTFICDIYILFFFKFGSSWICKTMNRKY